MRVPVLLIFALVAIAGGCRVTMQREVLERELREQEDRIYYLEDQLTEVEAMLEASREQNAELLQSRGGDDYAPREIIVSPPSRTPNSSSPRSPAGASTNSSGGSQTRPLPAGERPTLEPVEPPGSIVVPPINIGPPPGLEDPSARRIAPYSGPPVIRPRDPRVPEADVEPSGSSPATPNEHRHYAPPQADDSAPYELPPEMRGQDYRSANGSQVKQMGYRETRGGAVTNPFAGRSTSLRTSNDEATEKTKNPVVASITLDRRLTGGWNADKRRGDEGIAVVVELRNSDNEIVNVPATISVVVVDPSRPTEQSRVSRWDLKPNQVMNTFRKSLLGYGSHLTLPWTANPPRSRQLQLHVRATTPDGRVFNAEKAIQVDLLPGVVESLAEPLALPVRTFEECPPCDVFDDGFCPAP